KEFSHQGMLSIIAFTHASASQGIADLLSYMAIMSPGQRGGQRQETSTLTRCSPMGAPVPLPVHGAAVQEPEERLSRWGWRVPCPPCYGARSASSLFLLAAPSTPDYAASCATRTAVLPPPHTLAPWDSSSSPAMSTRADTDGSVFCARLFRTLPVSM